MNEDSKFLSRAMLAKLLLTILTATVLVESAAAQAQDLTRAQAARLLASADAQARRSGATPTRVHATKPSRRYGTSGRVPEIRKSTSFTRPARVR